MKTYFVTFRLFNGENRGWAFKEEKIGDFALAIQKYGELVKTYYGKNPFVFGYIKVEDERGNRFEQIEWGEVNPSPQPEPTPEVVEEVTE